VYSIQGGNLNPEFCSHDQEDQSFCSVLIHLFIVGALKYYMQMFGRDVMSSCWRVWNACQPSFWRTYCTNLDSIPPEEKEPWTIKKMAEHYEKMDQESVQEARQKKGVVRKPVWEFIEPKSSFFLYCTLRLEK